MTDFQQRRNRIFDMEIELSTPLEISMLIHCCTSKAAMPNASFIAQQDVLNRFICAGIISNDSGDNVFYATDKGRAWLEAILRVQLPNELTEKQLGFIRV